MADDEIGTLLSVVNGVEVDPAEKPMFPAPMPTLTVAVAGDEIGTLLSVVDGVEVDPAEKPVFLAPMPTLTVAVSIDICSELGYYSPA